MAAIDPDRKRAQDIRDQMVEMRRSLDRGEIPKNQQLELLLDQGNQVLEGSKQKVQDPEGKKIVQDTQNIINSVKGFIETKNQDEALQRLGEAASRVFKDARGLPKPSKSEKERARRVVIDLRGALRILITSGNFRRTLLDLFSVLSQIGSNLKTQYKDEEKFPENLRFEPWEKLEDSIDSVSNRMGQQKLDTLDDRIHRLLQEAGRSTPMKNFVTHFYSIFGYIQEHTRSEADRQPSMMRRHLEELLQEIRAFLLHFTSGENLDNFGVSSRTLLRLSREDESLKVLGQDWKDYLDVTLNNPDLSTRDENKDQLRRLVQKTRYELKQEKFSQPFNMFLRSVASIISDVQNDPVRIKLEEDIRSLFKDLLYDRTGHFSINSRALQQLRKVIIPSIIQQLSYIALPPIQSVSSTQEYVIKDLIISVPDVLPEMIRIETQSDTEMLTKSMSFADTRNNVRITLSDIELHIRSARVHYKRKSFPKVTEDLVLNTDVYGPDTSISILILIDFVVEEDRTWARFQTQEVDTKLDHLKIKAVEGRRDTLVNILTTLLNPIIKRQVQKAVSQKIQETVDRTLLILNDSSRQLSRRFFGGGGSSAQ